MAIGFSAAELMPWSMLGDVVDQDELLSRERREGLFTGIFLFLRKLGGAVGVAIVLAILDVFGFEGDENISESGRQAIRYMMGLAPPFFLLIALPFARRYSISRREHAGILAKLEARRVSENHS